jgi:hypothetical protein
MKVTKKPVPSCGSTTEEKKFDKLINQTSSMKKKYRGMDEENKKKVLLGIASAFAVLTSIATVKKISKKRKAKKIRKDSK